MKTATDRPTVGVLTLVSPTRPVPGLSASPASTVKSTAHPAATTTSSTALEGGISYAIGPGITGSFSVMYAEWEPGNGEDADGIGGILGMKIGF